MNVTRQANIWIVAACMIFFETNCSNIGQGFGSYDKPTKQSNKYYRKEFSPANSKLLLNVRYQNMDTSIRKTGGSPDQTYFIFYANGFVTKDARGAVNEQNELDYSKITYQMVGSYITVGDTLYWGTKAGYMKKVNYYKAVILEKGLQVIDKPDFERVNFLEAR